MTLNNEARKNAIRVFESMGAEHIVKLRAIAYWNDDEGHTEDDIQVWLRGDIEPSTWNIYDINGLQDLLWSIDGYGIYEVDAIAKTVSEVGEAWIPEPVLEKKLYDTPRNVVAIDPDNPFLPLVEYSNTGPFDDPLALLWNQLAQVPTIIQSRMYVTIADQFMGWQKGTKVDVIVEWFKQANPSNPKRFSAKYNK